MGDRLARNAVPVWPMWPWGVAVVVGALVLMKLEPGWKFSRSVFFIVNVAAGVGKPSNPKIGNRNPKP